MKHPQSILKRLRTRIQSWTMQFSAKKFPCVNICVDRVILKENIIPLQDRQILWCTSVLGLVPCTSYFRLYDLWFKKIDGLNARPCRGVNVASYPFCFVLFFYLNNTHLDLTNKKDVSFLYSSGKKKSQREKHCVVGFHFRLECGIFWLLIRTNSWCLVSNVLVLHQLFL